MVVSKFCYLLTLKHFLTKGTPKIGEMSRKIRKCFIRKLGRQAKNLRDGSKVRLICIFDIPMTTIPSSFY